MNKNLELYVQSAITRVNKNLACIFLHETYKQGLRVKRAMHVQTEPL
jgi:hypothetical protein